ncbi:ATP-binding protein [uncultured Amphritea sp.]|uniref:ATP-binding protein n=1 Tax=uncultured Amphritea sp. TaxID=981605 RepID=UPI002627C110|nr:ATP-binding protein [uncultured Amphritea sp.]
MISIKNNRYGIRQQVLLITLIPLLAMTLILAGYFVSTRVADNKSALIERGETMSRLLAQASEFGLISGLTHQLSALSQGPIQEADVADVIFIDPEGKVLYRSNDFELKLDLRQQANHLIGDAVWLFTTPVTTQGIVVSDSPETSSTQVDRELLGWVVVAMSTKPMHSRENQIITNSLLFMLGGLVCTFIIAARFAETLTKPIISLTNVVKKLEEGDLDARVEIQSYAELGSLEKGINLLGEQVQSSNQILESQVEKATEQLRTTMHDLETQNIALQKARQRADQANLAKDQFLARMSHELRTPLTSILGFTNMLRQTDLSFEQQEHCRIINQTSTMLLSLIDDILDFAKLQSDAIKLERIQLNPEQVIYEALEMQSQSAAAKGLELAYQVDEAAYTDVVGDPTRLRQIATNLISNAIKFTDKGQILVTLRVIKQNHNQRLMQLCVKDTGIGIAEEQQALLFNAFAQADPSITRRFGGSGLGLVIVQKLVELMQGSVELSSKEKVGTQICCSFSVKADPKLLQAPEFQPQKTDLIIFDRHPDSLESLSMMTQPLVSEIHPCATIQDLEKTLSGIQGDSAGLLFGLSANSDIANQQKLKIAGIFASFKGPILLLTPALAGNTEEFSHLRNNPLLTINSKPLHRDILKKWLCRSHITNPQLKSENSAESLLAGVIVLLAEDNDFNRLLLRKIIESAGASVFEARDGEQAIKRIHEIKPDIIVMDVHMPKMDGIMATREVRKHFPTLPIIALTADVISSEEHALRQAGVNVIEYKPINDTRLIKLLEMLCEKENLLTNPTTQQSDGPEGSVNLVKYQLSKEQLHQELTSQIEALQQAFKHNNRQSIRDHSHQLIGLAGLFELPELENCSVELNDAAKARDTRKIWELLSTLKRLIAHQQYLD